MANNAVSNDYGGKAKKGGERGGGGSFTAVVTAPSFYCYYSSFSSSSLSDASVVLCLPIIACARRAGRNGSCLIKCFCRMNIGVT